MQLVQPGRERETPDPRCLETSTIYTLNIHRKIVVKYLDNIFKRGCNGFDVALSKVLPLVMMSAIDCRIGDCVATGPENVMKGECMKLQDISLIIEDTDAEPSVTNVVAFVTIAHEKGQKKKSLNNRTRRVESFNDPLFNVADIVLLLIAYGLRHFLFKDGITLDEVLAAAKARRDRTIRWKTPEFPFRSRINTNSNGILNIDVSATSKQPREPFSNLGDLTGYFPRLLTHDIRRGAAKDLSRLPKEL